jgi:hypothetical protein
VAAVVTIEFYQLGDMMRAGPQPVDMLVDEWLPKAVIVWLAAEPAAGKTWLSLWLAARVIADGGRVAYLDAELGFSVVAERLVALGCDPDEVDERLYYSPYPELTSTTDSDELKRLAVTEAWDLVVFDPVTDFLSGAGADENAGTHVTSWVKAFAEVVVQGGATALVCDHVVKSGETNGYAVGSRAKKAKTKVHFAVGVKAEYDRETVGTITVEVGKNTTAAPIPRKRTFAIGPLDGPGTFDLREVRDTTETTDGAALDLMAWLIADTLKANSAFDQATALSQSKVTGLIHGNATFKAEAARLAATSPLYPVHSFAGPRSAIRYWVDSTYSGAAPTNSGTGAPPTPPVPTSRSGTGIGGGGTRRKLKTKQAVTS